MLQYRVVLPHSGRELETLLEPSRIAPLGDQETQFGLEPIILLRFLSGNWLNTK